MSLETVLLRILTVCTGNVCRSPLAAQVLQARLAGLSITVRSAGTHARRGMRMPSEAVRLAVERGADPLRAASHEAQLLTANIVEQSDLILAMTRDQRRQVVELAPVALRKTFTVREVARLSEGMDGAEAARIIRSATHPESAASRFEALRAALISRRGLSLDSSAGADDDVVDPYGRSAATYQRSAEQLDPGLLSVERLARFAVG